MKLKHMLKFMFHLFCIVTTFQLIFVATLWTLAGDKFAIPPSDLFKLPFIAFMSVLPCFLFVYKENISRTSFTIRLFIHFILTAATVFGLLIYFGWLQAENAIFIVLFFLVIYFSAYITQEIQAKKLANKLNEKISAFHNNENATPPDSH